MKKFFMIACMMLMSTAMFAQGKMAVGANVGYAPSIAKEYSPMFFGAKFQYEFVESFRAEFAANMFTKKDGHGFWDAELNFQYLIPVGEGLNVYPVAGLAYVSTTGDGDSENAFGLNAGAGIEYYVADNIKLNADLKYLSATKKKDGYKVIDLGGLTIGLGVAYVF